MRTRSPRAFHTPPPDPFTAICMALVTIAVVGALWSLAVHAALATDYCR